MLWAHTTKLNNLNKRHKLLERDSFLKLSQRDEDILTYVNTREITFTIFKVSIKKNLEADEFPTEF